MHQICTDHPGEGEWARNDPVGVVGQAQQQKCDQRNRNLNANGVLGGSEKMADFQDLLDPSEEQLDRPATFVQISDVSRAGGQIIGKDAQRLAGLDNNPNFADEGRHRVVARSRETLWKISGPIADDRASRWHRPIFDHRERRIGLELRDNATAGLMQPRPPAVVVVTEVENVGRSRLDRHLLGDRDVIDVGRSHHEIKRLVGIRIVDDVRLGAANSCRKRRPIAAQTAQLHARGIDQTDAIANFATISTLQLRHQRRQQAGKHFEGTRSISRRERRLRNGAASEMIKLARVASQVRFDLAQAARTAQLPIQHRDQMGSGLEAPRIGIGMVLFHKPMENRPRNVFQQPMKNDILVRHGVAPFSCPVDSQTPGNE